MVTAQTFYLEDGEPYTDLVVGEGLTRVGLLRAAV